MRVDVLRSIWRERGPARLVVRPVALGNMARSARELPAFRQPVVEEEALTELHRLALARNAVARVFLSRNGPWPVGEDRANLVVGICPAPVGNVGPAHPRKDGTLPRRQHTPEDIFCFHTGSLVGRLFLTGHSIKKLDGAQ